jgi:hypothetical protein
MRIRGSPEDGGISCRIARRLPPPSALSKKKAKKTDIAIQPSWLY